MLRVEPEIKANYVAYGTVSLAFSHVLDHGNASRLAHRAAECAAAQKPHAFWQMHDLLFERQDALWRTEPALLVEWATEIGLEGATLAACLDNSAVIDKVERIDQRRRSQGIRIRPTFVLNGQMIEGAIPFVRFVELFAASGVE